MKDDDYYSILGVQKDASDADIKKAFRKLSSAHHPDKHTSASEADRKMHEEKFKEANEAYEVLSNPTKRAAYDNPQQHSEFQQFDNVQDILRAMRRAHGMHGHANFEEIHELMTSVPIAQAFNGFEMKVHLGDKLDSVKIPAGVPHMARGQYKSEGGKKVIITVRFIDSPFVPIRIDQAKQRISPNGTFTGIIETGDVELTIDVDALDIMNGVWMDVRDLLGDSYSIRIPSGHNPDHLLKVKGKGYKNWNTKIDGADPVRADMYVRVRPVFKPIRELDSAKVLSLYEQVQAMQTSKDSK